MQVGGRVRHRRKDAVRYTLPAETGTARAVRQKARAVYCVRSPFQDGPDEPLVLARMIFQVRVLDYTHRPRGQGDGRADRGALTAIRRVPHDADGRVAAIHSACEVITGSIGRAVVDDDHFLWQCNGQHQVNNGRQGRTLVVDWHEDR